MNEDTVEVCSMHWVGEVLRFWFEELTPQDWFIKDATLDDRIRQRFVSLHEHLTEHGFPAALDNGRTALAMILVLDQFPRNMFRNQSKAFASDAKALQLTKGAVAAGLDAALSPRESQFLYMPLQHSENLDDQEMSVALYENLELEPALDYAKRHKQVIERFGRFPHRNAILGRASTDEEVAFIALPGTGF